MLLALVLVLALPFRLLPLDAADHVTPGREVWEEGGEYGGEEGGEEEREGRDEMDIEGRWDGEKQECVLSVAMRNESNPSSEINHSPR